MDWNELTAAEKEAARVIAHESLLGFTRCAFRFVWNERFSPNWHHTDLCRIGEDMYFQRSTREIANVAPGGTKTKILNVCFPGWGILREFELARVNRRRTGSKSPRSTRWLLCAYSDELVTLSSGEVLDIVRSDWFRYCCDNRVDPARGARHNWMMEDDEGGTHECYGQPLLGQITGHRAGFLREGFSGALLVDDPMPPRDERSFTKKDQINRNLNRVVRNRLMHDKVPLGMIQQRITTGDQTDFMRSGKALDDYRLTKLPALITPKVAAAMPLERRRRMIADTGFDGVHPVSYWEEQVSTEFLMRVRENDAFLFSSQYQQAPDEAMLEGTIFRQEMAKLVEEHRDERLKILPHVPVDTYWDLGINDDMAITLAQSVGRARHVIGAYHNNNLGLEHYLTWMLDYQRKFGIRWGKHYGPHDLKNRGKFTAKSDAVVAMEAGLRFEPAVERPQHKRDAIEATRRIFPVILIDRSMVEMDPVDPNDKQKDRWLWAALERYHRKYDPENDVFSNEPAHDWASNPVDSFMLMGLVYRASEPAPAEEAPARGRSFWGR